MAMCLPTLWLIPPKTLQQLILFVWLWEDPGHSDSNQMAFTFSGHKTEACNQTASHVWSAVLLSDLSGAILMTQMPGVWSCLPGLPYWSFFDLDNALNLTFYNNETDLKSTSYGVK